MGMDDSTKAVLEKYSWEEYPSKHNKNFEIGAFDLETSLATDEVMHITDQEVSDADCSAFGNALTLMRPANLKHIYLSNNKIGDAGLTAIAEAAGTLPNFELLYVAKNKFGDAGVKAIVHHLAKSKLWQLVLTDNKVGDESLAVLADAVKTDSSAFGSLKWLFLDGTEIGDKGVTALAEALTVGLKAVTRLALQDTKLTNRGLKSLAEAISKGALPKCEYLYVQNNDFDAAGKQMLKAATKPRGIRTHFGWPPPLPGVEYD